MSQEAELYRLCVACQDLFSSNLSIGAEVRSDASFARNKNEGSRVELKDRDVLIAHLRVEQCSTLPGLAATYVR
jgi:hypothetical protein